jgi:hypothetical protein
MASRRTPVYLGRTKMDAGRSSAEIQQLLVSSGARQIAIDYGPDGRVLGMRFSLEHGKNTEAYALPIRTDRIFERLQAARKARKSAEREDRQQAERVAWRQLLLWLKAQLALMDIGMVSAGEVFFPYQLADARSGATVYQMFEKHGRKLLAAADERGGSA